MRGERKYLLYKGAEMPHNGALLRTYMDANRIYQAPLARALNRNYRTIIQYKNNHSLQAAILWEISHALKHNFFADLAAALPDTFTRNSDNVPNEKDEQIAALQAEVLRLQQDKELLMELARKGEK